MKIENNGKEIIASIYDEDGNYYVITRNKKVFKKENRELTEVIDVQQIDKIFNLFKPGKSDVIY